MSHLWSPWRMDYIKNRDQSDECPFCVALDNKQEAGSLVVHQGVHAFVMLNRYPYTSGHLMVLPYRHQERLAETDRETRGEMMELIQQACAVLEDIYHPEGFNVGLNLGEAAGAGLPAWMDTAVVTGLRQLWRRRLPQFRKQSESTRAETTKALEAAEPEHTSK